MMEHIVTVHRIRVVDHFSPNWLGCWRLRWRGFWGYLLFGFAAFLFNVDYIATVGGAPNMCITIVKCSKFERPYLGNYLITNEKLCGFGTGGCRPIDCRRVVRL